MKSLITLVVLCTALFIAANAAPFIWNSRQFPIQSDAAEVQSNEGAEIFKNVLSSLFSVLSKKIENGEIQSNDEFARTFLDGFSNLFSAASKKVNPNDKLGQMFFNLADTFLNKARSKIGNGQQAEAEISTPLISYADNAAMMEASMNLSDEAKAQLWGKILRGAFKVLMDRAMKG